MNTFKRIKKTIVIQQDIRVKTYSIVGFTLLTVIILIVFAIRPVLAQISTEIGELNDLQNKEQQLHTSLTNLESAEVVYNSSVKGNTDTLNTALPDTPETGPLFANINAISIVHNIQIDSVQFTKQGTGNIQNSLITPAPQVVNTNVLYFNISGTGKFSDFISFMSDLENYPRIFNVQNTTLSSEGSGLNPQQTFSFSGYVYYLKSTN